MTDRPLADCGLVCKMMTLAIVTAIYAAIFYGVFSFVFFDIGWPWRSSGPSRAVFVVLVAI